MMGKAFLPYALASVLVVAATALTMLLWPHNALIPFALYYPAILVVTVYGSTRSGILALILSLLAVDYFFITPLNAFFLEPDGLLSMALFGVAGGLFVALIHRTKKGDKNLLASEERLRTVVEHLTEGLVISDLEGHLLHWNRAGVEMHGFASQAELRRRLPEFVDLFELSALDGTVLTVDEWPLPRIFRKERVRDFEVRIRRIGTEWHRVLSYNGALVREPSGEQLAFVSVTDITARKQTEEALKASEERLQIVTENSHVGLVMINRERRYTYANAAYAEMLALPSSNLAGQRVSDVLAPFYEQQIRPLLDRAFTGERVAYELQSMASGENRYHTVRYEPTRVGDQVPLVVVVTTDITERRQAEEFLRASEARYRSLFEYAPDGIFIVDSEGGGLDANTSLCRMLGYSHDELTALHASKVVAPAEIEHIATGLAAIKAGSEYQREWQFLRRDGSLFAAEVIATLMPDGNILSMIRDITARKEEEMARSWMAAIIESSNDAVIGKDLNGVLTSWNAGAERIFGYSAREILGISVLRLVPPERQAEEEQILSQIRRGIRLEHFETVRVTKDGRMIDVSVTVSPIKDAAGKVVGASKIARDITERRRAEAALHEANESLERKVTERTTELRAAKEKAESSDRLKSEFLASMSHELRTPLNGIIGFSEFLLDGKPGPLNAKQDEYLHDVLNSGRHLLQLINDVLDLAKVEAGKIELNPEDFSPAKAIEEVCAVINGIAQKKRVDVAWTVSPELAGVTLDQQKFKQVCYNLLANGVKFTDPGGSVEIHASAREGGRFEIQVIDSGIGIRRDDVQKLFRKFEQLETDGARKSEGTGLGLALTKKLVEFQGGSIGVESEYGKGSTFSVTMPRVITEEKHHVE